MNKLFIVAEVCTSHLGDYNRMIKLIDAAADARADAVKFQFYTPGTIAADVMIESGPWKGRTYQDLYQEGYTPWSWMGGIFKHARSRGLLPFASPFSVEAIAALEEVNCMAYKIASPEIVHLPLIAAAAKTGKFLIISTGMATLAEILAAHYTATVNGATDITYLHCLSAYPAKVEDFNMETLGWFKKMDWQFGLSDHSLGYVAPIMAVTMGATVIEKHLTLSRADGGPDAAHSLEPHEFADMVEVCRATSQARGEAIFGPKPCEKTSFQYRRSIWLVRPILKGQMFTADHFAILRPNYGLEPHYLDKLIGGIAVQDVAANSPMKWEYLQ